MNHKGTIELETERLILRKFKIEDAESMFNNWASDEEVTKYLTWKPHKTVEVTKSLLTEWVSSYINLDFYQWGIVIKETNELIGSIGVVGNKENRLMCEIGYCIGKSFWGKGYVAEAFTRIIDFLFTETNCNRIEAVHDIDNPNSGKVMLKCGLTLEGVLRQRGLNNDGEIIDLPMYSLLKKDYKK